MVDNRLGSNGWTSMTVIKNSDTLKFVPDHRKTKKCVSMQLKNYFIYQDMFLIIIRLNKCAIKLL